MRNRTSSWALWLRMTSGVAILTCPAWIGCGSSSSDDGNGNKPGGNGTDIIVNDGENPGGDPASYEGGSIPLPEGGLDELRGEACTGWSGEPEGVPSILQLVVDISGSMDWEAPNSNETKWEITREALRDTINDFPASTGVGVLYYPNTRRSSTSCFNTNGVVPVQLLGNPDSQHRADIEESLDDASPRGGTPTHDAYDHAVESLEDVDLPGDRFILLITDGQPTYAKECNGNGMDPVDVQPIIDAVETANNDNSVRTFLIGSPGSEEARSWLSRAAELGGTATSDCSHDGPNYCHIDLTEEDDFSAALRNALGQIAGQIVSCDFTIPDPPDNQSLNPSQVNVVFTPGNGGPKLLLRDDGDCSGEGWRYTDNGSRLELCKQSCDEVQSDNLSTLELLFGCSTVVPIR